MKESNNKILSMGVCISEIQRWLIWKITGPWLLTERLKNESWHMHGMKLLLLLFGFQSRMKAIFTAHAWKISSDFDTWEHHIKYFRAGPIYIYDFTKTPIPSLLLFMQGNTMPQGIHTTHQHPAAFSWWLDRTLLTLIWWGQGRETIKNNCFILVEYNIHKQKRFYNIQHDNKCVKHTRSGCEIRMWTGLGSRTC